MTRLTRLSVIGLVVVLAGIADSANAADVVSACSRNTNNKVRSRSMVVNATAACRATEALRSWNEVGPQGPAGPSDAFSTFGDETPLPNFGHFLTLATLSLDAGSYVITGKATLVNSNAATTAIPYCMILRGPFPNLNDQSLATINGAGAAALTAVLAVNLPTPMVVQFRCTNNTNQGADGDLEAEMVKMVAIRVGTLTDQSSPSGAFLDNVAF